MPDISTQLPADGVGIERLLDLSFGPQRHLRPSYRLRDGVAPLDELAIVARDGGVLVGSLRFWPLTIGAATPAILLGPLAVHPEWRRRGVATDLVTLALDKARRHGHRIVVAIGTPAFFGRFGFVAAGPLGLTMPVPVDESRFLAGELIPGALFGVSGVLSGGERPPPSVRITG